MFDLDELTLGTKETHKETLTPKKVQVKEIRIVEKTGIRPKVILICKHPDKEETIEISEIEHENKGNLVKHGLWLSLDPQNRINYKSVLGLLLYKYDCNSLKELIGKELETTNKTNGYLILKI